MEKDKLTEQQQHEMFVWKQNLSDWKTMYMRGDAELISKQTGVSRVTVLKAIRTGNSSYNVLHAIAKFYEARKKLANKKN